MSGQSQFSVSLMTPNNERGTIGIYNGVVTLSIFNSKSGQRVGGVVLTDEARDAFVEIIKMCMNDNASPVKHFITVSKNNRQTHKREVAFVLGVVKAEDGIFHFELRLNGQAFSLFFPKNQNVVIDSNTSSAIAASRACIRMLLQWLTNTAPIECSRTYEPMKRDNAQGGMTPPQPSSTSDDIPF